MASCKFINEYRIIKADQTYVQVIEQDQPLAFDIYGNMWLSLSIIDIAPNQMLFEGLKSQVINFKTGAIIPLPRESSRRRAETELTQRETEVLKMIRAGLLSKEISGKFAISVHTVNKQQVISRKNDPVCCGLFSIFIVIAILCELLNGSIYPLLK
jgi:hypothetical protein